MGAHIVYDQLCELGQRRRLILDETIKDVRHVVRASERVVPPADIDDQLAVATAARDSARIELSRHCAHCTTGCRRASSAQQPTPYTDADPWSRSPTRKGKPSLPGGGELAAMIREDGLNAEDLAAIFQRSTSAIRANITDAGWSATTGEPSHQSDDDLPAAPLRPFQYPAWFDDANCAGTDPEAFFPKKGGSTRQAKAVCARCPVAAECLDYALEAGERFGIFGGLSERERRRITTHLETKEAS